MLFSIWWDICHTFYYFLKDGFLWFFEHVTSLKSLLYKSTIWAPSKAVSIACFSLYMSQTFLFLCTSHNSFQKTGHFRQYIASLWVQLPPLPQGLVLVCSLICLVMCAWLDCFGQVCLPPSVKPQRNSRRYAHSALAWWDASQGSLWECPPVNLPLLVS